MTTRPTVGTKEYTITALGDQEVLSNKFTVSPDFCASELTFSATGLDNFVTWSEEEQTITYAQISDSLALSGSVQQTYQVTISFTTFDFSGNPTQISVTYDVIIKNPCIDQQYVVI